MTNTGVLTKVEIAVRKIIRYEHTCKRCACNFISKFKKPLRCGRCKTGYWNIPRPQVKEQEKAA